MDFGQNNEQGAPVLLLHVWMSQFQTILDNSFIRIQVYFLRKCWQSLRSAALRSHPAQQCHLSSPPGTTNTFLQALCPAAAPGHPHATVPELCSAPLCTGLEVVTVTLCSALSRADSTPSVFWNGSFVINRILMYASAALLNSNPRATEQQRLSAELSSLSRRITYIVSSQWTPWIELM